VGDGEKLLTYLNSVLKVLSGLDIFPRGTKKKGNFVDQCNECTKTCFLVIFVYKGETSLDIQQKNKEQLIKNSTNRQLSFK
jgi:rRNA maturation protein Rpf1